MSFRVRLVTFVVALLVAVQALTGVLVYGVTRHALIGEGQRQLGVAAGAFARQLDDLSERVAASVQVLSLDFALRSAIAQQDRATVLSALSNHGRRVGATQMLLVGLDGRVEADTAGRLAPGAAFPYADLVEHALQRPASAVVASHDRAHWMVVVPVFAPDLVGFIAAAIPVDDRLLARLQAQSALPKDVELATVDAGRWRGIAHGAGSGLLVRELGPASSTLPMRAEVVEAEGGREYVMQAVPLARSRHSAPVVALLGYSVDAALAPYRAVGLTWAALLGLGLLAGVAGAWLIARSVSRPVERLAASARRIEAGDYAPIGARVQGDELGALAAAFDSMAAAIREREARILHQAAHDPVTGLPNRSAAESAIQRALDASPNGEAALLMVGLERVPDIVKTLGHGVGDRLMHDVGRRLALVAGAEVARATDSRFAVFLPVAARADAVALATRLVDALAEPYREADVSLDLAPAVGIALAPLHGRDAAGLLRRADVALLAAAGSEGAIAVYDEATDPHRPERLSLMGDLLRALEQDEGLALHYQPKLDLATGRIDSVEALVRWRHPRLGLLPPDAFVGLAEQTGHIRRLTRWVLATGIAQASRWHAAGRDMRVSINVSARDVEDAELPRRVAALLAAHGLPAACLVLEITESALMRDPDAALPVLERLAAQGIALSIDDFGVGQSSFAYLRRLPVRELKIDRAFVAPLAQSPEDRVIVRSIVELAHALGCRVTAEGVEERAALDYLATVGCDHAQGYLVARPMEAVALDAFEPDLEFAAGA